MLRCVALIAVLNGMLCQLNVTDPSRFLAYLQHNKLPGGMLPIQSYYITPENYFETVPDNLKPHDNNQSKYTEICKRNASADEWNAYEFQTENMLTAVGLNIYDGAVWSIASSLLNDLSTPGEWYENVMLPHKTEQMADIKGDRPCKGVVAWKECHEENEENCGFCYGDIGDPSLPAEEAYFFRMISDWYSLEGTKVALCPEKNIPWAWNDWKPITGENAWANFIGPLQSVYLKYGRNVNAIPDDSAEMQLAATMTGTMAKMVVGDTGAVYFCPRNTWFHDETNMGSTVSTENNASLMAGLRLFLHILKTKSSTGHAALIPVLESLLQGIEKYLLSAYDTQHGYFRQGGTYDPKTKEFKWGQGDSAIFAVDCQTWTTSVLGADVIDKQFGAGTAKSIWDTTKSLGGYGRQINDYVKGVGFSNNAEYQVFSGEWTFGAINMLRVITNTSDYDSATKADLNKQADFMRASIEQELTFTTAMKDGTSASVIKYANKRYWIPFGWWANPLPATASIGWAVMADLSYNPFMLGGSYKTTY